MWIPDDTHLQQLWVCGRPSSRYKADTGIAVLPDIYTFPLPRDLCLVKQSVSLHVV